MKKYFSLTILVLSLVSCNNKKEVENYHNSNKEIVGTWKLFYGEIRENDSTKVKDLSNTDFIKIINDNHFAFFNQKKGTNEGFYGGGGSYTLIGNKYIEKLNYISVENMRGHELPFTIEIKGDTLIQYGKEEVKEANIDRDIVEKYIRLK